MNIATKLLIGSILLLLFVVQSAFNFSSSKSGYCPLRNTVTSCTPRCMTDWDCGGDRKCCPNYCDSMSCAESSAVETSDGKYGNSNLGVVKCSNVVCQPKQICKTDRKTKRQYCAYN